MPEIRELLALKFQVCQGIERAQAAENDLSVLGIAYDPTEDESLKMTYERGRQGLPLLMESSTRSPLRGTSGQQGPIYPPLSSLSANTTEKPIKITDLVLKACRRTNRALVLDFTVIHLKIQVLKHTSVQWYPREVWLKSVWSVPGKARPFKIGVAFIFNDVVLAFVTQDNIFQPMWRELDDFQSPPSIDTDRDGFLSCLVVWISKLRFSNTDHSRLACNAIREARGVFEGFGVYSIMEVFIMAGLSPFLSVKQLFTSPSRTARLVAAMFSFIDEGKKAMPDLLPRCIHNGLLAPTTEQRLRYTRYLHVWAKGETCMSKRMATLCDAYNKAATTSHAGLQHPFDVFEPSFVRSALQHPDNHGHLIFGGTVWPEIRGSCPLSGGTDPLTVYFKKHSLGTWGSTELDLGCYRREPLLLSPRDATKHRRPTFAYRLKGGGSSNHPQMWTILKPLNSRKVFVEIEDVKRTSLLFKSIVHSPGRVAVGPLEYCGNGHIINTGKRIITAVGRGDPGVPYYHEHRFQRALRNARLYKNDPLRTVLTSKKKTSFYREVDKELDISRSPKEPHPLLIKRKQPENDDARETSERAKAKRKRISADLEMVTSAMANVLESRLR